MPFKFLFLTVLCLTVLSGVAATWLVLTGRTSSSSRNAVADRLAQIALLGAAALIALMSASND